MTAPITEPGDSLPSEIPLEWRTECDWILVDRQWSVRVISGHDREQLGRVRDGARERSIGPERLVKNLGLWCARNSSHGRTESEHVVVAGRVAQRATRIASIRYRKHA